MKLKDKDTHEVVPITKDVSYKHTYITGTNGKRVRARLTRAEEEPFDLGSANPEDELGFSRYTETVLRINKNAAPVIQQDALDLAQQAVELNNLKEE